MTNEPKGFYWKATKHFHGFLCKIGFHYNVWDPKGPNAQGGMDQVCWWCEL